MKALSALFLALMLAGCANAPEPPAPPATECIEIGLYSNGFHSSVISPREALEEKHPFRRLFPDARWFAAGWGDEAFFRAPAGGDIGQGLRAALPGGPTVVQVISLDGPPERYFRSGETIYFAISRSHAAGLARYLSEQIVLSSDGSAVVVGPGHHAGRSSFVRGQDETFSLFNNCNHWTARALRAAGIDIGGALTANALAARAGRFRSSCLSSLSSNAYKHRRRAI